MILGFGILGNIILSTALPPAVTYAYTHFYGNINLDEMQIVDEDISDNDILDYDLYQTWLLTTIMYATFDNTLEAGNIRNSDLPITHWRISRRRVGETQYTTIDTVEAGVNYYTDYSVRSSIDYEYAVFPLSNGIFGSPIGGIGMVQFFGWKLSNLSGSTSFSFDMEIDTDNIRTIEDRTKLDNYSQFPLISRGLTKYNEGKIKCIPYEIVSNNIEVNNDVLEELETFINDGEVKILRNGSGKAWQVDTSDFSYKYFDNVDVDYQQPFSVEFSWTQIGEVAE